MSVANDQAANYSFDYKDQDRSGSLIKWFILIDLRDWGAACQK